MLINHEIYKYVFSGDILFDNSKPNIKILTLSYDGHNLNGPVLRIRTNHKGISIPNFSMYCHHNVGAVDLKFIV